MSERLDHILDVIDAGLQSSTEHGYGTDTRPERCVRCQLHEPEDGDLCGGCRTFLLEDSDSDPLAVVQAWQAGAHRAATGVCHHVLALRGESADMVIIDESYDVPRVAELAEPIDTYMEYRQRFVMGCGQREADLAEEFIRPDPALTPRTERHTQ